MPDTPTAEIARLLQAAREGGAETVLQPAADGRVRGSGPVNTLHYFPSVTSTNDVLKTLAQAGARDGYVVVSGEQTAGRGRHGRTWYSPPGGGLYLSLLLRPEAPPGCPGWITLGAALALVRAGRVEGLELGLKWPNDLLCSRGGKVAGVLVESGTDDGGRPWLIIGTGINLRWGPDVPREVSLRATTLEACAGRQIAGDRLLARYLQECRDLVADALAGEKDAAPRWADEIRAALTHLDRVVTVRTAGGDVSGRTLGLSDEGWLLLDGGRTIMTGELIG